MQFKSQVASGTQESLNDVLSQLFPPKFDLRSAFDAALAPAGMPEGDGEEDEDADDGSGDDDTGSSGDGEGGSGSADDVKDPDKKRLSDEAAKHRVAAKTEKDRADALAAKLKQFEDKDKTEFEKVQRDLEETKAELAKHREITKNQAVDLAFFKGGAAALFKNPATALKLLDVSDIAPDDEGNVDTAEIKKRADALLKAEPYLAKGDDSAGDDEGSPSGGTNNGKRGNKGELDKEKLAKKFPALRR